jgi:tetratricopeptide (TPR) repeat protein
MEIPMTSSSRVVSLLLAGFLVASATLAQTGARVFGEVEDENGKPIAGVKITVTTPSISTFKIEETTSDKGAFRINLVDATRTYRFKFEKAGYKTMEDDLKVGIGANERKTVKMLSTGAALAAGELKVDPAIEAFNAGAEAYSQGDTSTARRKFEEALAANPQLAAAHAALGRIQVESKAYAEGAAAAERALAIEPANTAALRVAVAAYEGLGDAEKAAAARQALTAADPKSAAGTFYAEGVKLFNAGKTEEAAASLEKAVAANPDHAKSHYILGLCYSGMGESAKAKEHLQTFLKLAPTDEDAGAAQEMLKYL